MSEDEQLDIQYGTADRLTTRAGVWCPAPDSVPVLDAVVAAAVEGAPRDILDVGCGTGHVTRLIADAAPAARVIAIDRSAAMVDAARAAGLTAQVATATALPFEDASFDVVTCTFVLYHVPAIDRALREMVRVLRPGGRAVIATSSERHLHELFHDAGRPAPELAFRCENAGEHLARHFAQVAVSEHPSFAHFATRADAERYLSTLPGTSTRALTDEGWPRDYPGLGCVYVCSNAL